MEIAILGGGVAGISSAIALKQKGFNVRVYERHKTAQHIGAGVVIWPNAAFVLDQLGLLGDIAERSGRPSKMQRLSSTGESLGTLDIATINQQMGYPSFSILRRDLQAILTAKLASLNIPLHYDHAVTRIDNSGCNQAEVHFQNGARMTADILIGADGRMASYARRYVHGDNSPVYQGFINWVGVFEGQTDHFAEIAVSDYWGVGERFGIVPVSANKAYWAGAIPCAQVGSANPAEYRQELTGIFADWPEPVVRMIEGSALENIHKIYVHDHDPIQTWHKDNLLMIGDAAHAPLPTSGQGACQALEDTWQLAQCLQESPDNIQRAFIAFTAKRYAKTAGIIMAGRGFAASLFNPDKDFCEARNKSSQATNFADVAVAMARGWSQGLPLGI